MEVESGDSTNRSHSVAGDSPGAAHVRSELARILNSQCFVTSGRMRALLEYLVNETLDGRGDRLKEYTIGIEVFGRDTDFDPRIETVVRTEAWRLRSRLTQYYRTEGVDNPVRIELAKRSFAVVAYLVPGPVDALTVSRMPQSSVARMAVLPFAVIGDELDLKAFGESLADEVSHALGRLPRIEMVARSSCRVMAAAVVETRETAQRLGAGWIVEGSVRRSGSTVRVLMQLVEARSGCQVWMHAIEQQWNGALSCVESAAGRLVMQLMESASVWQTPLAEAFVESIRFDSDLRQMLLLGIGCPPSIVNILRQGIGWLEDRLRHDPLDTGLQACLASLLATFISIVPAARADLMPHLKRSAIAAATSPRDGAHGLVAWGMAALFVCDWSTARVALERAIALTPQDCGARMSVGLLHLQMGNLEEAHQDMRVARELRPLSASVTGALAAVLMNSRRYGEAVELARRAVALDPDFKPAQVLLADAMFWDGRVSQALGRLEELSRLDGRTTFSLGKLGYASGRSGNAPKAREILDELSQRDDDPARVSMARTYIHLGLGDHDSAFEALDTALEMPTAPELLLRSAPQFDPLRTDARFAKLLARLGMDTYQTTVRTPLAPAGL